MSDVGPRERRVAVVQVTQQQDNTWQYTGSDCVVIGPRQVTPEMVRQQAVRLIPTASVGLAPHGSSLVNIETVMWAGAPRVQQLPAVTLLGQQVSIRIVLDHVAWNYGDGSGDSDGPAGKRYDGKRDPCRERQCAQYFGHTYTRTGTVTVSATAYWRASFTVGGGAPVDIPGTVGGPTAQAQLVVKQARGVLVPNPGDN
ncbi:hypothetical protein [Jatrophihabitans fulvus]